MTRRGARVGHKGATVSNTDRKDITMNTHTKTALAAGVLALFGLVSTAHAAPVKEFAGTRGDARILCETSGGEVFEGLSYTLCVTATSELTCFDGGVCATTDLTLPEGIRDAVVAAGQN